VRELDEDAARAGLAKLRAAGIEALAVSLINAFANDQHERRLAELAAEELPGVPVSLSSVVLPELREYERALTTVANGYVQPQVARYLANLTDQLSADGVRAALSVLRSDGGLTAAPAAIGAPVTMLLSGPAGGVAGAVWVAEQSGHHDLLTFDMGGTSTDVALVQGLRPRIGRETKVGDLTVRAAAVDVRTVGAGGGSIAHVPELTRALRVGPQSAGADPGPVAYGKGGSEPTVTDANLVLGYLPTELAGGEITLDAGAARASMQKIADAMGLPTAEAAAAGIVDIVNENMLGGLRLVSVQQGFDPRDFALVAFGGAGPLHANALGRLTGAWPVIVPPSPGVLCALGDATTSARDESARTCLRRFADLTGAELAGILRSLSASASERLVQQGIPAADQETAYQVDVRYFGQGFDIPLDVDPSWLDDQDGALAAIAGQFDAEHERLFSFVLGSTDHELVNARASVSGPRPRVSPTVLEPGTGDPAAARTGYARIWVDGGWQDAARYDRALLRAGDVISGPAIVTEMDSTTLILPGHAATADACGSLLIRPAKES
jgi:N-methylhydantoinase A